MAHQPETITEIYAWVVTENDGREGLPAVAMTLHGRDVMMPLIGADRARIALLRAQARHIHERGGSLRMRLCRFQLVEVLETL